MFATSIKAPYWLDFMFQFKDSPAVAGHGCSSAGGASAKTWRLHADPKQKNKTHQTYQTTKRLSNISFLVIPNLAIPTESMYGIFAYNFCIKFNQVM